MVLIYNCNEDVAVATFISRMQVTNPFCKHLVKNDVTKMRDILVRAQKYIQIEDDYVQPLPETRPRDREAKAIIPPEEES